MRRRSILGLLALGLAIVVAAPAAARPFPSLIQLPVGWQPEGIATGKGHTVYVGSLATGSIWRGDLRTGIGAPAVTPPAGEGRVAVGIKVDNRNRIFVAGGATGKAWVYDARTGATLASYTLAPTEPRFINDVVVTRGAAWFTNSSAAVLYRVPIGPGGQLGGQADVKTVPLTGDYTQGDGFNVNGIDATPNGTTLIIVQSNLGRLYKVDPSTGVADLIELGGLASGVPSGDGILLHGKTLYVVENFSNRVSVVRLAAGLGSGTILRYLTDSDFDVPTTIARADSRLYAVNARFGNPSPATATYAIVQVTKGGKGKK
jgi:sugar lactone lactonase YvrE